MLTLSADSGGILGGRGWGVRPVGEMGAVRLLGLKDLGPRPLQRPLPGLLGTRAVTFPEEE